MGDDRRMSGRARAVLKPVARRALVPVRRVAAATISRYPSLGPRVGQWSWLWQPGWDRRYHEDLYASGHDPYGFDDKPGEQQKYRETLALVADRRYARALEIGAAEGAFTEMLSGCCDEVVGTDISEVALERARQRFAGRSDVTLERRTTPFDFPDGDFDLIACSDVVYLWEVEAVTTGLRTFAERLRPRGRLLLVHYLGVFGSPVSGDFVHDLAVRLAPELGLEVTLDQPMDYAGPQDAGYRATVLTRSR